MIRTRSNVNWEELKKINWFVCPECEISFSVEDWNKETSLNHMLGVPFTTLPLGAIEGWKHYCPDCKKPFDGSELIIDED